MQSRLFSRLFRVAGLALLLPCLPALAQAPAWTDAQLSALTLEEIGDAIDTGEAAIVNGNLVVTSGGSDIWGATDNFTFIHRKATGNFSVTVQMIEGLEDPAVVNSKAGVMVRSSNAPNAADLILAESPRRWGIGWEGRRRDGVGSDFSENPVNIQPPAWMRIVRVGRTLIPFVSEDGVTFTQQGTAQGPADFPGLDKDELLVGIATSAVSSNPDQAATATYGPFAVVTASGQNPPPAIADLALTADAAAVTVGFTAPADNLIYLVVYSDEPITADNWTVARTAGVITTASKAGDKLSSQVTGIGQIGKYYVGVIGVDANMNSTPLALADVTTPGPTVTYPTPPANGILHERFTGISGGAVETLLASPLFPLGATVKEYIPDFETPTDDADAYGARLRAYFVAPATGDYTFWIASDDHSDLYLSTDESPQNARRIAGVPDWTGSRAWDSYASQKSASIPLESGKRYYIEALHKEGGGGDNLAVKVTLPDGSELEPLGGEHVVPFVPSTEYGRLRGRVVNSGGAAYPNTPITISGPGGSLTLNTDTSGAFSVLVPSGSYRVSSALAAPLSDITTSSDVTVATNQVTTQVVTFNAPPVEAGSMSLASADLPTGTGWAFLQTTTDQTSLIENDEGATDYAKIAADWCADTLPTTGTNATTGNTWLANWPAMPGDPEEGSNFPTEQQILDNTFWVQALRFQLPAGFPKGAGVRYAIEDFIVDDYLQTTCLNGVKLQDWAGRSTANALNPGANPWEVNWQIPLPADLLRTTGENLLVIVGEQGGGGGGVTGGTPRLVAYSAAAAVVWGDLNNDGNVNVQDATLSLRIAVGLTVPDTVNREAGDVNHDGKMNVQDATLILRKAVGLPTTEGTF